MKRTLAAVASTLVTAAVLFPPQTLFSHETVTTTVLFDREIVRILNSHCVMCHVEGGPSFPLATYEQAWLQKRRISAAVLARHMPPWAAMPGYGRFANENVVTLRESQFLVSWMEGLGPRNAGRVFTNTAAAPGTPQPPAVRAHADFGAWRLGQPDLVRDLPPVTVAARREDDVARVVVDAGIAGARQIRALEYMPGDRRVVRAAFFTVQETGQWIGSWTPWYGFVKLPAGVAYNIPAGAHIAAEIHYRHAAEQVVDRGRIGLFFETASRAMPAADLVIEARKDDAVAAGGKAARFHAEMALAADTSLLALRPDVAPGLTSVELSAKRPDGGTDVLLFAKDVPEAWPTPYIFKEPVVLRRGTRLSVTAYAGGAAVTSATGIRLTVTTGPGLVPIQPRR